MSSPVVQLSTTQIQLPSRSLEVLSIDLVVVDGPCAGLRVHIDKDVARIGSAAGNELCLSDPTVSRAHCELRLRRSSVLVKDCGSTNGTFVEGVLLREGEVKPGATIRVGHSVLRIEAAGAPCLLPLSSRGSFGELIGASREMRRVYAVLERVAPTETTLLIQGETGTGKDVAARSVHAASPRAKGPFVPVDCGAIPENLIESELFGHARGAFSGAIADRRGVFEEAQGGTLFLDEIGEMPLSAQAKLLRAIEMRAVRRVGENIERNVDVRVIAATNRSLAEAANTGKFREDLYYRLAVVEVELPPLRARAEDIPLLAQRFYASLVGDALPLPDAFVRTVAARTFPGNVRELRNFVERSVSLGFVGGAAPGSAPDTGFEPRSLDDVVPLHLPLKDARQVWLERFESVYVQSMLKKTRGNVTRAAELSGVSRRFMQRLIGRLGLREPSEL